MSLTVIPRKNHLKTIDDPFIVRSCCSGTVEVDELIDIMAKGRTTLSKPDIAGCLKLLEEELSRLLADGKYVKTPMGSFYLSAAGKLHSVDQSFAPKDETNGHTLSLHFRTNRNFEAAMIPSVKIVRSENFDKISPALTGAVSVKTSSSSGAGSGDFIRVSGKRLKFDPADGQSGVFFVNGSEHRSALYADIEPSLVIAQVPQDLAPGPYILCVRTAPNGVDHKEGRLEADFAIE
jgi:hypothetical protein